MTQRACVRCGRVGSLQFSELPQGDVCTAEKACRRRIQDQALDQAADIDDDRWFDYVREDFPKSLGTITAHSDTSDENGPRYWIGVHGWNPEIRACSIVLFEEPTDTDGDPKGVAFEDWEHPSFTSIVVSQRWDEFDLLPLAETDLIDAAQVAADERFSADVARDQDRDLAWEQSWQPGQPVPPYRSVVRLNLTLDSGLPTWVTEPPPAQEAFYNHWRTEWNEGRVVDIDGNVEYVERYVTEVTKLPLATARVELKRLLKSYGENERLSWLVKSHNAATAIVAGDFEEALGLYKTCYGFLGDEILSLRLALGTSPTGSELAYFAMLNFKTQFRSSFSEELLTMYGTAFEKTQADRGTNLLQVWAQGCSIREWRIVSALRADIEALPPLYAFFESDLVRNEVKNILKGAEEELRGRLRDAAKLDRQRTPVLSPATDTSGGFEQLTCVECGRAFERPPTRGRKPQRCAECRMRAT